MKRYYKIFSVLVSVGLLYFLLTQIKFGDVAAIFARMKLPYVFAAFVMYIAIMFFRVVRFRDLIYNKIGFWEMAAIACSHAFINGLVPARMGEFAYVYYVKKTNKVPIGVNVASLFNSRAFDTLAVIVFMGISLFSIYPSLANGQEVIFLTVAGVILITALFALFVFWETKVLWIFNFFFAFFRLNKSEFGNRLLERVRETLATIAAVREPKLFIRTCFTTIGVWLSIFFMIWFIALGFGVPLKFWENVFAIGIPALVSILPFYSVGNFGVFEGAKSAALVLIGFQKAVAISYSFVSHISEIALGLAPGIIAYIILARKRYDAETSTTTLV